MTGMHNSGLSRPSPTNTRNNATMMVMVASDEGGGNYSPTSSPAAAPPPPPPPLPRSGAGDLEGGGGDGGTSSSTSSSTSLSSSSANGGQPRGETVVILNEGRKDIMNGNYTSGSSNYHHAAGGKEGSSKRGRQPRGGAAAVCASCSACCLVCIAVPLIAALAGILYYLWMARPHSHPQEQCTPIGNDVTLITVPPTKPLTTTPAGGGGGGDGGRRLPNLFVEMLGVKEEQVDRKLGEAWEAVFQGLKGHGDCYQQSYYQVGRDMAYVMNTERGWVTSEGMSYGMMIAVQLGRREEFDRLWAFTKANLEHKDGPWKGMMAWKVSVQGKKLDANTAPDGDIYLAAALLIAHSIWGDEKYLVEGKALMDALGKPDGKGILTTDGMVKFAVYEHVKTNPSYHLPCFFDMFARVAKKEGWEDSEKVWTQAARVSRDFLKDVINPKTGLAPDYAYMAGERRGRPFVNLNGNENFQWDAWRVVANTAVDWAWWSSEEWERDHADTLQEFFASQGISTYPSIYSVQGDAITKWGIDHSAGLVAMNAVASLAARDRVRASAFVKELWEIQMPTSGMYRYYPSMLYMIGLLHVSGRFGPVPGLQEK